MLENCKFFATRLICCFQHPTRSRSWLLIRASDKGFDSRGRLAPTQEQLAPTNFNNNNNQPTSTTSMTTCHQTTHFFFVAQPVPVVCWDLQAPLVLPAQLVLLAQLVLPTTATMKGRSNSSLVSLFLCIIICSAKIPFTIKSQSGINMFKN